ncbi:MAG: hypothetical protein C0619_11815 [Desulfuromonas sp.]|nr:MAG: hypothetical protein C0619_11815 [Desulfuromonas sp.]
MAKKEFLKEEPESNVEDTPENSAFACEQCNKMYFHEDALAISMTCCGQPLKELHYEAVIP